MEDSQVQEQVNNEDLIQEMLRDAEIANIQTETEKNPIIHQGDEALPAPMTIKRITSAGYRYVYDKKTGEKVPVLYYMVPQVLRKKDRKTGELRFTVYNPHIKPPKYTQKCWLHTDHAMRESIDGELPGMRTCAKSNLINPYQVTQHMKMKHPREFEAIEELRKRKEREEDRKLQQELIKATTAASKRNKKEK